MIQPDDSHDCPTYSTTCVRCSTKAALNAYLSSVALLESENNRLSDEVAKISAERDHYFEEMVTAEKYRAAAFRDMQASLAATKKARQ